LSLKNSNGIELIPYHAYGGSKNEQLGLDNNGKTDWIPSSNDIKAAKEALEHYGCKINE